MKEIWKPIFEGKYCVSNLGRIKTTRITKQSKAGGLLKPRLTWLGYSQVCLYTPDKKHFALHRLVMLAFCGESGGLQVNHKNGVKVDNRLKNLEYLTASENVYHAMRTGLGNCGERHHSAKLRVRDVKSIRARYQRGLGGVLAREFGIHRNVIYEIVNRTIWKYI